MTDDVIALVQADHRRLEALFKRLLLNQQDPKPTVAALHALLTAHIRAEEDVLHPLLDARHAFAQHKEIEGHLDALRRTAAGSAQLTKALHQLVVAVMAHIGDEETTILPMIARRVSGDELTTLGQAFAETRQRELDALRGRPTAEVPRRQGTGRFGTGKTTMHEVLTTL